MMSIIDLPTDHKSVKEIKMYYGKVEICGVNTSKLKNLTTDEKNELLMRAKEGDLAAREELINGNLRLVLSIIQKFIPRCEDPDDLFQVGCVGLIKAIDNFDISHDVQFSTYAVPMIIGEVRRYLRDNNTVRVSRSMRDLAYKALSIREYLSSRQPGEPTVEEITAKLNETGTQCCEKDVAQALTAIIEPVSIFEPVYTADSGEGIYLMDQLCDEESPDEIWTENIALREAMKKLNRREHDIIRKRYSEGQTQSEIASEIGISQAQVSRLEKAAIEKIKNNM